MNKKIQQLVPIIIAAAAVVFVAIVFVVCKTQISEYIEKSNKAKSSAIEMQELDNQAKQLKELEEAEQIKFKSMKPIYETEATLDNSDDNLGVFGNIFEQIIKKVQQNGLLIRSIEYDMRPASDPIYAEAQDDYNVCELKFFFVGSYVQLLSFLNDLNKNSEYFIYLSALDVTAFSANQDYLLINMSINIYSKKPESKTNKVNKPVKKGR